MKSNKIFVGFICVPINVAVFGFGCHLLNRNNALGFWLILVSGVTLYNCYDYIKD